VLSKFVPGLSTVMPPLAGAMRVNGWVFAVLDGTGTALWIGAAIALGMLFHHEIGHLIVRLQEFGTIAIGLIAMFLAGYISMKWWRRHSFHSKLRTARITVDAPDRLVAEGRHHAIVGLPTSLVRDQESGSTSGALRLDSDNADQWLDQSPGDREIILYCTSRNRARAAYVARKLMDRGYTRVRSLLGGSDGWITAGYGVDHQTSGLDNRVPTDLVETLSDTALSD
jgi:rhodanese-related sulfurtransferase